jgi:hypothetical protein
MNGSDRHRFSDPPSSGSACFGDEQMHNTAPFTPSTPAQWRSLGLTLDGRACVPPAATSTRAPRRRELD